MTTAPSLPTAHLRFPALGTTAEVVVSDPTRLPDAVRTLRGEVDVIDQACSRFRPDSEISRLHARAGSAVVVSPLLGEALRTALRAADLTGGLVDPTVGHAVQGLGYDRDFSLLADDDPEPARPAGAAPGWWRVQLDDACRQVVLPRGVVLDLGATAKALAADRAVAQAARVTGCGVLISLGGDLAVAGPAPEGGWRIVLGDDHARVDPDHDPVVAISSGALATSSTVRRSWRRAGQPIHHIVDPRSGTNPEPVWRTVSVAAASCVDANTAATAAIVLGRAATAWLTDHQLPARLVAVDGRVTTVAEWPTDPYAGQTRTEGP